MDDAVEVELNTDMIELLDRSHAYLERTFDIARAVNRMIHDPDTKLADVEDVLADLTVEDLAGLSISVMFRGQVVSAMLKLADACMASSILVGDTDPKLKAMLDRALEDTREVRTQLDGARMRAEEAL